MRRTSLEIDEERLAIDRVPDEVVLADLRYRLAKRIQSGKGIDRGDEVLKASRRWER